ncbi:hypothetical protein [Streptomyces sp. WMMC940]|uniref:hypothetical protein n=1 Tax=Streptomyces sp. WMMC940 TaxID=3015153 RepID=UPI0022B6CBD9|nr:hypothetical protein [Streptomyces sp. WMMC940]MCZ7458234.1 hypothetical protein [Streptomyces sp. WMMC940]
MAPTATAQTTTAQPTADQVAPWDAHEAPVMTLDGRELTTEAAAALVDEELAWKGGWGHRANRTRLADLVGTAELL